MSDIIGESLCWKTKYFRGCYNNGICIYYIKHANKAVSIAAFVIHGFNCE